MKIALLTSAPNFKEGYRLEEQADELGYNLTTINVGHASFIVDNQSISLIADVTENLKSGVFKKQIIKLENYDYVITQRMFKFIKQTIPFIEHARKNGVRVFDNNLCTHSHVINKIVDEIKLGLNAVKTPKTIHARDFEELPILAKKIGYPLIFKNTNKGKGVGVEKIDTEEELKKTIAVQEDLGKKAKGFLIQEYIKYKHDLRVFVMGEKMYAMERIPAPGEFRANFSLGGKVEKFELTNSIADLVVKAKDAVGLDYAGVDVLISEMGEEFILEVNHTPGFVGLEQATGKNIAEEFIKFAIENAK